MPLILPTSREESISSEFLLSSLSRGIYSCGGPTSALVGIDEDNAICVSELSSQKWAFKVCVGDKIKHKSNKDSALVLRIVRVFAYGARKKSRWDLIVAQDGKIRQVYAYLVQEYVGEPSSEEFSAASTLLEDYLRQYRFSLQEVRYCFSFCFFCVDNVLLCSHCFDAVCLFRT